MIYITGDPHREFDHIADFCRKMETTKEDVLVILGDVGINYFGGKRDKMLKKWLTDLPITFFCIHGNHEQRPFSIPSYHERIWHGGTVYMETQYPSLVFAKDGELYDLGGNRAIVIGGAYSVDKNYRLAYGYHWWADEQPSEDIKQSVEQKLSDNGWNMDFVLSHTTPYRYIPTEAFLPGLDQSTVDNSTEKWLGEIEERLEYKRWYRGHYHISKRIDKLQIMFHDFDVFPEEDKGLEERIVLWRARNMLNMTQQEVADRAEIQLREYQRFESGERKLSNASMNIAIRVLNVLDLDAQKFLSGEYGHPDAYSGAADESSETRTEMELP